MQAVNGNITLTVYPPGVLFPAGMLLPVIAAVKKHTGGSLAEINTALNQNRPVEAFNYLEAPERIPGLLALCEELGSLGAKIVLALDGGEVALGAIKHLWDSCGQVLAVRKADDLYGCC